LHVDRDARRERILAIGEREVFRSGVSGGVDADRLEYGDEVYVPGFQIRVRTVDDTGTLHYDTTQIDVWMGRGDSTLAASVSHYGVNSGITCLKILKQ